jgi:hypothetical protein
MKNENLAIELINEIDINEISPNLEYNIMIIGQQGKIIIQ